MTSASLEPRQPQPQPLILAVDTTHEFGSLALARGAEPVDEMALHAADGFGHLIYGYLEEFLRRNGVKLPDIDCFAAAAGPGSFTGVRIGLACVKGLAEAMGKPAIGVSNLQAIASFGTAPLRAAVMDARRGDVYGAVYGAAGELVLGETVSKFSAWLATLPGGELEILSPDLDSDVTSTTAFRITRTPREIASALARLAFHRLAHESPADPAALDANYVRRSDAEMFWKDAG